MPLAICRCYDRVEDAENVVGQLESSSLDEQKISIIIGHKNYSSGEPSSTTNLEEFSVQNSKILSKLRTISTQYGDFLTIGGALIPSADNSNLDLISEFVGLGIKDRDANIYAETIRRGGTAVVAIIDSNLEDTVKLTFANANPVDEEARLAEYKREGWRQFGAHSGPYRSPYLSDLMH